MKTVAVDGQRDLKSTIDKTLTRQHVEMDSTMLMAVVTARSRPVLVDFEKLVHLMKICDLSMVERFPESMVVEVCLMWANRDDDTLVLVRVP